MHSISKGVNKRSSAIAKISDIPLNLYDIFMQLHIIHILIIKPTGKIVIAFLSIWDII